MVEDLLGQGHLTTPGLEVDQVEAGRAEPDLVWSMDSMAAALDEGQPTADPDHQPGDRRIGLVPRPPADDVDQAPDLGPAGVAHRPADQTGQ